MHTGPWVSLDRRVMPGDDHVGRAFRMDRWFNLIGTRSSARLSRWPAHPDRYVRVAGQRPIDKPDIAQHVRRPSLRVDDHAIRPAMPLQPRDQRPDPGAAAPLLRAAADGDVRNSRHNLLSPAAAVLGKANPAL